MLILTPGHKYELRLFEQAPPYEKPMLLQFIEKKPDPDRPGELVTVNDGTTNEEVLRVLIDRLGFLQAKMSCRENALVLTKLEECLMWLNHRTEQRRARDVEGTAKS